MTNKADKLSKANSFCIFLSTIPIAIKKAALPLKDFTWKAPFKIEKSNGTHFKFKQVSQSYVENQLKTLKRGKAVGINGLPPGMLKDAAVALSGPLSVIINLSLESCSVPKAWKTAKVIAQHKGVDRDDMTNYCPISILPVISKVMERAVHEQLTKYLEENKILSKTQFGYRKGRSTELATLFLTYEISKEIDNGKMVGALFIDLSKAFDTLSHSILISKMRSCGQMGDALHWFMDYLFDRSMICEIDSQRSEPRPITSGVPQGSILGPILLLIHFNDFEKCLKHSKVITFADDTVVYLSRRKHTYIEQDLNGDLQNIAEFFTRNELVIILKPGKNRIHALQHSEKAASKW